MEYGHSISEGLLTGITTINEQSVHWAHLHWPLFFC